MSGTVEKDIIEAYRLEDEKAQQELLQRLSNLIGIVIAREIKLGISYPSDRDDLYQEGLIALDRAIRTYDIDSQVPLEGYAYLFIKRQIRNYTLKHNRIFERRNLLSLDKVISEDNPNTYLSLVAEKPARHPEAEDIIKELPPMDQTIVRMRLKGYKYREIAEKLSINEKKVDNVIYRLKQRMEREKEVEEHSYEDDPLYSDLQEKERMVLSYRMRGYKYAEIAKLMHITKEEATAIMRAIRTKAEQNGDGGENNR